MLLIQDFLLEKHGFLFKRGAKNFSFWKEHKTSSHAGIGGFKHTKKFSVGPKRKEGFLSRGRNNSRLQCKIFPSALNRNRDASLPPIAASSLGCFTFLVLVFFVCFVPEGTGLSVLLRSPLSVDALKKSDIRIEIGPTQRASAVMTLDLETTWTEDCWWRCERLRSFPNTAIPTLPRPTRASSRSSA